MKQGDIGSIIFDMDGVIFDSERLYIECCLEAGKKLGLDQVTETCMRCIGVTREVTSKILLETYGSELLVERFTRDSAALFMDKYSKGLLGMKPGVTELLTYLKESGYRTAIASSTVTDIVEKELSEAQIRSFFDCIVGGDQVQRSKPNPDIFLRAAELLGESSGHCAVIEDSYNGIRAAKAAGMTAIMVPDLLEPNEEMKGLADCILPSLFAVRKMLAEKAQFPDN